MAALRVALALSVVRISHANMLDVIEPTKLPPPSCGAAGCASWAGTDKLWRGGKVPASAANHCAQPGAAVNSYPYGSWCTCANKSAATVTGSPATCKDVGGSCVNMLQAADLKPGDKRKADWLSFTGLQALLYPPSATTGRGIWRLVPSTECPVGALTSGCYYIENLWKGPTEQRYGDWLAFDGEDVNLVKHTDLANRAQWSIFPAVAGDGTFYLQNLWRCPAARPPWAGNDTRCGWFVGSRNQSNTLQLLQNISARGAPEGAIPWRLVPATAPKAAAYCVSAKAVPEQINLQIASPSAVVVQFVTFEDEVPTAAPTALLTKGESSNNASAEAAVVSVSGVTHPYRTAGGRLYYFHFVRLENLLPRQQYSYQVKSGGAGAALSPSFGFRAPYGNDGQPTRIDIFGDLGIVSCHCFFRRSLAAAPSPADAPLSTNGTRWSGCGKTAAPTPMAASPA